MKLPLIAMVLGLLAGIALTIAIAPETPAGSALIIIVATLVVTVVVLAVNAWRTSKNPPKPEEPA